MKIKKLKQCSQKQQYSIQGKTIIRDTQNHSHGAIATTKLDVIGN